MQKFYVEFFFNLLLIHRSLTDSSKLLRLHWENFTLPYQWARIVIHPGRKRSTRWSVNWTVTYQRSSKIITLYKSPTDDIMCHRCYCQNMDLLMASWAICIVFNEQWTIVNPRGYLVNEMRYSKHKYCINYYVITILFIQSLFFTGLKIIGQTNLIKNIRIIFNTWMKIICSQWLSEVWSPWTSANAEFPPLRSFARPLLQLPSVSACLWVFLPSVLSSVCENHAQLGWG